MSPDPLGRRDFLSGAGGVFLCTLAGQKVFLDRGADVPKLASGVAVPRRAGAAEPTGPPPAFPSAPPSASGNPREYWIKAGGVRWNIAPSGRDQMMNKPVKGKTTFTAYAYRPYTQGFKKPAGPATIPGPLIEAEVGDAVVVHFRNGLSTPVTMHPHGIHYPQEMDGAYKGKFTDPGGFVQKNRTFTYRWEARAGTEGAWLYHDHGPMDPIPVFKGLFGPLIVRPAGGPPPGRGPIGMFPPFQPPAPRLCAALSRVNRA